jgi:hypothetical protein
MVDVEQVIFNELERISPLGDFEAADWPDALRRSGAVGNPMGTRRGRLLIVAALVGVAGILAATAFGLGKQVFDFFSADQAPPRIVRQFGSLNVGAPRGMSPNVMPHETRRVTTYRLANGQLFPLWVAPRRTGGFCYQFGFGGGCASRMRVSEDHAGDRNAGAIRLGRLNGHILAGYVFDKRIARLAANFKDGTRVSIPLLWVSRPIDAAFFLYDVSREKRNTARGPVSVVALDSHDREVARSASMFRPPPLWFDARKVADLSRRHIILRSGRLSIAIAPSRTGGDCYWLRFAKSTIGSGCAPPRFLTMPLAGGLSHGKGFTAFSGQVKRSVSRVELRFQDGSLVTLQPVEAYVLYDIPNTHWRRGRRLQVAVAYGAGRQVLQRQTIDPDQIGVYDCTKPVPLGWGEKGCR